MHSIGAILLHIVGVEIFWFGRVVLGMSGNPEEGRRLLVDQFDVDGWNWPDPPRQPIAWYFELHDRIRARTLDSIKGWPSADSIREWDGRPRPLRWILGHLIQYEAYHGGQAVPLNRLWELREPDSRG